MARVGLVFGGRSVEHEVSVRSARSVAAALAEIGHAVVPLAIGPDGGWQTAAEGARALAGEIDALPPAGGGNRASLARFVEADVDVVFPLVHGTYGEDGTLQGLCEMADVAYVGAGVTASALAMDKLLTKKVLAMAGIPVVDYESVSRLELAADPEAALARVARLGPPPLFVKPSVGGSSVGVVKVETAAGLRPAVEQALALDDNALVELAVDGRELECSVLGYPEVEASVVGEIRPGADFYDYADKYLDDAAEILCPAPLEEATAERIRRTAVDAFVAIGGGGMARIDFLLADSGAVGDAGDAGDAGDIGDIGDGADSDRPARFWVNEINTLPGFTSISMYPKLWEAAGLPLPRLVERLIDAGLARHRDRRRLDERIRDWLGSLR